MNAERLSIIIHAFPILKARHTHWRQVLEICALASGSKGNAVYVGSGGRGVLVDAGLPGKTIEARMRDGGLDPEGVEAVVLTHEHRDHSMGVGVWARRYKVPVYAADGVREAVEGVCGPNVFKGVTVNEFTPGETFEVAGLEFAPFSTSHDAHSAVGYRVSGEGAVLGFATDLGVANDTVRVMLSDVDILFLESNHDVELLKNGPYPAFLKRRIRSELGHLSNTEATILLESVLGERLKALVLGHLSETNNQPLLAYNSMISALKRRGAHEDVLLLVARQSRAGRVLEVA